MMPRKAQVSKYGFRRSRGLKDMLSGGTSARTSR